MWIDIKEKGIQVMDKKVVSIIDGNHFAARAFFALKLSDSKGRNTSAIYGVLDMLNNYIEEYLEHAIVVCWDSTRSKNRTDILPTYKCGRDPKDETARQGRADWINQMQVCKEALTYLGVTQITIEGYEGDELIYGVSKIIEETAISQIVTADKDLLQCVRKDVVWYDPIKKKLVGEWNFEELIGMKKEDFILYKCLTGDSGDDVPGVRGIGEITAKKILGSYHSIEDISANVCKFKKGYDSQVVKDILERNVKLMDVKEFIKEEILIEISGQLWQERSLDMEKFIEIAKEYDMNTLVNTADLMKKRYQSLRNRSMKI